MSDDTMNRVSPSAMNRILSYPILAATASSRYGKGTAKAAALVDPLEIRKLNAAGTL